MPLRGVFPALITPFKKDGDIDEAAYIRLMAWHESVGCAGVVVSGTNGEAASMSVRERKDLISLACSQRGRLEIIAGTGCASLGETIHLTNHAANEDADAALVMPPYYFKNPPEEGVIAYYQRLLDAARLPILLYNIPRLTDTPITPAVVEALRDHPNFGGIKDSSGDREYLLAAIGACPGKAVMTGAENLLLDCLEAGGAGTVSGTANCYPELPVAVVEAVQAGRDARPAQRRLTDMNAVVRGYPMPASNKAVVKARGFPAGHMRLPLVDLDESSTSELLVKLAALGLPVSPEK